MKNVDYIVSFQDGNGRVGRSIMFKECLKYNVVPSIGKSSIENSLKTLAKEGVIEKHGVGKATLYTRSDV